MSGTQETLLVLGMMLVTFGVRFPILLLSGRMSLPFEVEQALRYVPVAVLTALSMPLLLKPGGDWDFSLGNAHLLAGIAAALVASGTRHLLLTIVIGMAVFLTLHRVW